MTDPKADDKKPAQFDDVLRRMLERPPEPKVRNKPIEKKRNGS